MDLGFSGTGRAEKYRITSASFFKPSFESAALSPFDTDDLLPPLIYISCNLLLQNAPLIPIPQTARNTLSLKPIHWCEGDERLSGRTHLPCRKQRLFLPRRQWLNSRRCSTQKWNSHRDDKQCTTRTATTAHAILLRRLGVEAAAQRGRRLLDSVGVTRTRAEH